MVVKISNDIYIETVESKGRGVYTSADIDANTTVEVSPVIVMSSEDRIKLDKTLLHDYIFEWQPDGIKLCCMAQGYISVYNHSHNANCEYFMNYEDETITIKTTRTIISGEELCINYNGDGDSKKGLWFDVVE